MSACNRLDFQTLGSLNQLCPKISPITVVTAFLIIFRAHMNSLFIVTKTGTKNEYENEKHITQARLYNP